MKHYCRYRNQSAKSRLSGKIRKIIDFTNKRERGSRVPFPTDKVFDLAWPFHYRCRSEKERKFLAGRIRSYAFNHRRGSFKLPSRFSGGRSLVDEVSKLTKGQLRQRLFLVKPDLAVECRLLQATFDYANRVLTRCIWRFSGKISADCARRVDTNRLDKRDWPRNPRSLWPSSPTVTELLAMTRCGKTPTPLWKPPKLIGNQLRVSDLKWRLKSATRIVSDNVVGLRSTVPVPRKFLPWFRYRDGILFLTVRYSLPAGLVRLVLSQWIRDPFSLWLKVNCRLKYYLRIHEPAGKTGEYGSTFSQTSSGLEGCTRPEGGATCDDESFELRRSSYTSDESTLSRSRRTQHTKLV